MRRKGIARISELLCCAARQSLWVVFTVALFLQSCAVPRSSDAIYDDILQGELAPEGSSFEHPDTVSVSFVKVDSLTSSKLLTTPIVSLHGEWECTTDTFSLLPRWRAIKVPSNWYLQGIDSADGKQVEAVRYRTRITFPDIPRRTPYKRRWSITFEGVDYFADVRCDSVHMARHEGYFQPFALELDDDSVSHATSNASHARQHMLDVLVRSPREADSAWSLHKRLIKGIFSHHDTRPGGAWSKAGQDRSTGGIWAGVSMRLCEGASLDSLQIRSTLHQTTRSATLTLRYAFRCFEASLDSVRLEVVVLPHSFSDSVGYKAVHHVVVKPVQSAPSVQSATQSGAIAMTLPHVRYWYSYDVGEPNLYRLRMRLLDKQGRLLDERSDTIGIRSIRFNTVMQQWYLNGRRIFLRGTNYIASQWMSEMSRERYAADIDLMRSAHINAIRVHAHIAARDFYRAADAAGMLVWQDFPLQWGYADDKDFIREAVRQTGDMIRTLGNHPSIIAWSLHNEPPFDSDWMKYKYPDYRPQQNRMLNKVMMQMATRLEQTPHGLNRYVHPFSATPEHQWLGWYSGSWRDYGSKTRQKLITEFGAQGLPSLESLKKIIPALAQKPSLFPTTEEQWYWWEYHNFQRKETFENAGVKQGTTIEEFIENSQSHQARVMRLAAKSYRKQKYAPVGSIFQFMFVENWESINWGIVDYWRNPKPAYHALRAAYSPILLTSSMEPSSSRRNPMGAPLGTPLKLHIWLINDLWEGIEGSIEYEVRTALPMTVQNAVQSTVQSATHNPPIAFGSIPVRSGADTVVRYPPIVIRYTPSSQSPIRYDVRLRLLRPDGSERLVFEEQFLF
jgi:beta-mannosidase